MARNDQRRRRVVIDGALQGEDDGNEIGLAGVYECEAAPVALAKTACYDRRAGRGFQLRTTDLIPKRPRAIFLFVVAIVSAVAILNILHLAFADWTAAVSNKFSLGHSGSLTSWFSTLFLLLASLTCMQIYLLRQHRSDDYHGTYRIWLVFAGAMLVASMDCILNFGELLGQSFQQASSSVFSWSLISTKLLVVAGLFIRGFVEVRSARGSLVMAGVSFAAYAAGIVLQVPEAIQSIGENYSLIFGNTVFIGHAFLLFALTVYARNVFLTSNGLMAVRKVKAKPKPKAAKKTATTVGEAEETKAQKPKVRKSPTLAETVEPEIVGLTSGAKVQGPPKKAELKPSTEKLTLGTKASEPESKRTFTSPLAAKMKSAPVPTKAVESDDDDEQDDNDSEGTRRLSKSERRRLRKEQSSSRRAA